MAIFQFLFLLGDFRLLVLVIESFWIKLVYVEVILLSQKAIGSHFKELSGFFTILFHIFAENTEMVRTLYHETSDFLGYLLDYCKTIFFDAYWFKFYLLYLPYYHVINLQKLFQNAVVLQLKHDFHKLLEF